MFFANIFCQLWTNSEILNCEQSHVLSLAFGTVYVIGLVFVITCDQIKSEVAKTSLAELEPNPNCNNDWTEQNPNLGCWVRFPSLLESIVDFLLVLIELFSLGVFSPVSPQP